MWTSHKINVIITLTSSENCTPFPLYGSILSDFNMNSETNMIFEAFVSECTTYNQKKKHQNMFWYCIKCLWMNSEFHISVGLPFHDNTNDFVCLKEKKISYQVCTRSNYFKAWIARYERIYLLWEPPRLEYQ